MAGPWEKYQKQSGPWEKYASPDSNTPDTNAGPPATAQADTIPQESAVNRFMDGISGGMLAPGNVENILPGIANSLGRTTQAWHDVFTGKANARNVAEMVPLLGPSAVDAANNPDTANRLGNYAGIMLPALLHAASGSNSVGDFMATRRGIKTDPTTAIIKAYKPSSSNPDFVDTLPKALSDMKDAEAEIGRPVKSNEDFIDAAHATLDKNRQQWETWKAVPAQMNTQIDGTPIGKAMLDAAGDMMKQENPAGYEAIRQRATTWNRRYSVGELEKMLQEGNKRMNGFYNAAPDRQAAMLGSGLDPAIEEAKLDATRDQLYKTLDPDGNGGGPREIQQRYGAVSDLLNAALRRRNSILGSRPVSPLAGLREDIIANTRLWKHGDIGPGNADSLIEKAFRNLKPGGRYPAPADTPVPRGYLTAGPVVTPPAEDTSFVHGYSGMTQPPNPARALPPASTIFAGPVPDESFVRGANASPYIREDRLLPPPALENRVANWFTDLLTRSRNGETPNMGGRTGPRLLPSPQPGEPPVNILPSGQPGQLHDIGPGSPALRLSSEAPIPGTAKGFTPKGTVSQQMNQPARRATVQPPRTGIDEITLRTAAMRSDIARTLTGKRYTELSGADRSVIDDLVARNMK